jgi:hypothetical protein
MIRAAFLAVCAASLAVCATFVQGQYSPKVGQRHPDFTLADIATGKPVSLSDYRGKKVVLIQFASW